MAWTKPQTTSNDTRINSNKLLEAKKEMIFWKRTGMANSGGVTGIWRMYTTWYLSRCTFPWQHNHWSQLPLTIIVTQVYGKSNQTTSDRVD